MVTHALLFRRMLIKSILQGHSLVERWRMLDSYTGASYNVDSYNVEKIRSMNPAL